MQRIHFFEIADLSWCPQLVRDGITDTLQFIANASNGFAPIVPRMAAALERCGATRILDLGSGAGGGWLSLIREFDKQGLADVRVWLSDLYPNRKAFAYMEKESSGRIAYIDHPVDAAKVDRSRQGFRTMFNGFHHFRPDAAAAVLRDSVHHQQGIAIVDGDPNRFLGILFIVCFMPMLLLAMPFVKPFRWRRLFFTYVIPLIPLAILFDGVVSILRVYNPDELWALVETVPGHESYDWEIGIQAIPKSPLGMTYLIGTPKRDETRE
ncbi:hypothetical protein SCOR_03460 [Sulfidibacter corallicola]|uniref:Class I SAM-dependent methyltransferase n=1 Tax=Sulfidibacter corallicola TaxID=2818388 RepID=A0A8A4TFK2_SULCO|nr:hypothetical protein [Sulfidibacter corallicola]QTD48413.1 hypothetical protein J3U87_22770 [Sulfidibacter corallicola]